MQLFSVDECIALILGNYYRLYRYGRDRRLDFQADKLDQATGLPLSANDLAPISQAKSGTALALESICDPVHMATAHLSLTFVPKNQWTEEDQAAHSELAIRFKVAMARMAEQGLMKIDLMDLFTEKTIQVGEDGLPWIGKITYKGLEEAKRVTPGTPRERGAISILADAPEAVRRNAPEYARQNFAREG